MPAQAEALLLLRAKDEVSKTLGKVKGAVQGLADNLVKFGTAGAAGVAALGTASIKMAMDFEKSFGEVKTLLPSLSEEAFGKLQKDLLAFSKEMGIATSESVPALYQAISAGVPPDNVIDFMRTASKAAIGGVTDLETAVDGITSVVNAYGREAMSAGRASDVMFTAVKLGKTDFTQLSQSLFNVIPTAASLGVQFEEVAAALAVMTAQGVPTSVATTQLRQAFVEASKGGTDLSDAIIKLTGKSFAQLISEGKGASEIFEMLRQSMPEQKFKDLFGSVEAMNAVLQITGPNAEAMASALAEMDASAGATDKAFKTISETAKFKFDQAINDLKITLMEIGLRALPYVSKGIEAVTSVLDAIIPIAGDFARYLQDVLTNGDVLNDWLTNLPPNLQGFAQGVGEIVLTVKELVEQALPYFVEGLTTIGEMLQEVGQYIQENKPLLLALAAALGALAVVLFPIPAAIAALAAAITALGFAKAHWEEITEAFEKFKEKIESVPILGEIIQGFVDRVVIIFDYLKEQVQDIVDFFKALFTGDWSLAWEKAKEIVANQFGLIKDLFLNELEVWAGIFTDGLNLLKDNVFAPMWGAITDKVGEALGFIGDKLNEFIIGPITSFFTGWAGKITEFMEYHGGIFVEAWSERLGAVGDALNDFVIGPIAGFVSNVAGALADFIDNPLTRFVKGWIDKIGTLEIELAQKLGGIALDMITKGAEIGINILEGIAQGLLGLATKMIEFEAQVDWQLFQIVLHVAEAAFNIGTRIVEGIWEGIISMGSWLASQVGGFVKDYLLDPIASAAKWLLGHSPSEAGKEIVNGFIDAFATMQPAVEGQSQTLGSAIATAIDDGINTLFPLWVKFTDRFKEAVAYLQWEAAHGGLDMGLTFANSVAQGIQSGTDSVIAAAVNMVLQAIAAARAAAESASPSKEFMKLGYTFPEGLARGMIQGYPLVASAGAGLVGTALAPGQMNGATRLSAGNNITINQDFSGSTIIARDQEEIERMGSNVGYLTALRVRGLI